MKCTPFENLFLLKIANHSWSRPEQGLGMAQDLDGVVRRNEVNAALKLRFPRVGSFIHKQHQARDNVRYIQKLGSIELNWEAGLLRQPRAAHERHFLIISSPFGPFARELAQVLRATNSRVSRIALNAGDALDWRTAGLIPYRGRPNGWREWLNDLLVQYNITDMINYGDSKYYDRISIELARNKGLHTHILEQGYFRPNWVTLESQGVNSKSGLPSCPDFYRDHPHANRVAPFVVPGHSTIHAVWNIGIYHLAVYLGAAVFPHFKAGYEAPAWKQAVGHTLQFLRQRLSTGTRKAAVGRTQQTGGSLYLALLQRPGDSQLWLDANFKTIPRFTERVIQSFAKWAPSDATLLFRPHPLDPGLEDWRAVTAKEAAKHGVGDRVDFSKDGQLHEILPLIAGAVCVNSTAGLAAVEFGRPTIVLGRAIYNLVGLTHQDGLDSFWSRPTAPNAELYTAFRNVVMAGTQINGNYATSKGRALAAPEIARRLLLSNEFCSRISPPPSPTSAPQRQTL